jgi:hypothetical protein
MCSTFNYRIRFGIDRLCQIILSKTIVYQTLSPIQKLKTILEHFKTISSVPKKTSSSNRSTSRRLNSLRKLRTEAEEKEQEAKVDALLRRHSRGSVAKGKETSPRYKIQYLVKIFENGNERNVFRNLYMTPQFNALNLKQWP